MTCILVLGDGRVASGSIDGAVHVWDMTTMQRTQTLRGCHVFPINQLLELPDGRLLSTEREHTEGEAYARRNASRERQQPEYDIERQQQECAAMECSKTMLVWDLTDGSCTTVRELQKFDNRFTHVALLRDGSVLSLSVGDRTVRVWR